MKDENKTLTGWPAVLAFLMVAGTNVLTALVLSAPISWLVNRVFSATLILATFSTNRLGYWRCVGLFAIWFVAKGRIKWTMKSR